MKLVHSSFLIDYARADDDAVASLVKHDDEVIGAPTIVLSEIYRGLMLTREMTREQAMSKYEWVEDVPFTNEIAAAAAEMYIQLREDGTMIPRSDIYIAGTARSLGVPLVVGDKHFDSVDCLDVERYRRN